MEHTGNRRALLVGKICCEGKRRDGDTSESETYDGYWGGNSHTKILSHLKT